METSLNPLSSPAPAAAATIVIPRAITTKIQPTEEMDKDATLPSNKPFVAQVVTARLSGAEYPENPAEIAPADRTLRPYDVPMLPYDSDDGLPEEASAAAAPAALTDPRESAANDA